MSRRYCEGCGCPLETTSATETHCQMCKNIAALPRPTADTAEVREKVDRLLHTAKILYENAIGCIQLHHGHNPAVSDPPGWLRDCRRDIETADGLADAILAISPGWREAIEAAAKVCDTRLAKEQAKAGMPAWKRSRVARELAEEIRSLTK